MIFTFLEYTNENYTYSSDWSNFLNTLGQFFYLAIVFIIILVLAYFTTKWFSTGKYAKKGNSNIKIIESIFVNPHSNIFLIKVGEKYMLIGVTKEKINFLADVNKDELIIKDEKDVLPKIPFEKYLNQLVPKKKE